MYGTTCTVPLRTLLVALYLPLPYVRTWKYVHWECTVPAVLLLQSTRKTGSAEQHNMMPTTAIVRYSSIGTPEQLQLLLNLIVQIL